MTAIVIILNTFACVTVMAGSSRQLFAFARDGGIPFHRWVSRVRPGFDVPVNAVLAIFFVAACLTLINIGSIIAFNIITSLGTGTLTSSYIICIGTLVWRKVTGKSLLPSKFHMGRVLGLIVNFIALGWLCLTLIFAFFPFVPVKAGLTAASMNYSVVILAGTIVFAIAFFVVWARKSYDGPVEYVRKLD